MSKTQKQFFLSSQMKLDFGLLLKIIVLLSSLAALFWQDLQSLFVFAFQNIVTSYVLVVPVFFLYFLYRKRKMLRATISEQSNFGYSVKMRNLLTIVGVLTVATALLLYMYGSFSSVQVEYHLFSMPILVVGLVLILFNAQTLRQLFFPLICLFFLFPMSAEVPSETVGSSLYSIFGFALFVFFVTYLAQSIKSKKSSFDVIKVASVVILVVVLLFVQLPTVTLAQDSLSIVNYTPSGQKVSTSMFPEIQGYSIGFSSFQDSLENLKIVYVYSSRQASLKDVSVGVEGSPNLWYNSIWENYYWINYYQNLPSVSGLNSNEINLSENQSIIVGSFIFQNLDPLSGQNSTVQMVFWYESLPIHNVYSTTQPKAVMISLFAPVNQGEQDFLVKKQLLDLAIPVAENIDSTVTSIAPWSLLELTISQNGVQLSLVTGVLLMVTMFLFRLEAKKMRKTSVKAYLKLFKSDLQLIRTIDKINKDGFATLDAIGTELNNVRGQLNDKNKLMQEITELEKTGLIKRSLANKQDQPIQIWKT